MCSHGYHERPSPISEGWHRVSGEMIAKDGEPQVIGEFCGITIINLPPLIYQPAREAVPDGYEGKDVDEAMLLDIAEEVARS